MREMVRRQIFAKAMKCVVPIALALVTTSPVAAAPVLVDGVAASVGRQVITLSEVDVEARLLLVQRGGVAGIDAPIDDALRAKVLEYLIVQEALVRESSRRGGILIAERDIDRVIAMRRAKVMTPENYAQLLAALVTDEERLRAIARRDLIVTALLERALPRTEIDDAAVSAYLYEHPEFRAEAPEGTRKAAARTELASEQKQIAFDAFTTSLLQTVEVRRIASYAMAAPQRRAP